MANIWDSFSRTVGNGVQNAGSALHLPELGVSELFGVTKNTGHFTNYGNPTTTAQNYQRFIPDKVQGGGGVAAPVAGGGPSGGGAAGAAQSAAQLGAERNKAAQMLQQMNDAYNSLFGAYDSQTQDARSRLDTQYNDIFSNQDKQYQQLQDQTQNADSGRGIANSSYAAAHTQANTDSYNADRNNYLQDRDSKYAQLGQANLQAKQQLGDRPGYDLSQYNDVGQLQQLHQDLAAHIDSLKKAQSQVGPQGQFINELNKVAPAQQNGQLQDKLSKLASSSAPGAAKATIARGYIKLSGQNPDDPQWASYYASLGQ